MTEKKDFLKRAFRPLEIFLILAVCAIFIQVVVEVISRYLFSVSIAWGEELAETLIVWVAFIGASVAFLYGEHMAVNIIHSKIKNINLMKIITLLCDLSIMFFLILALIGGAELVQRTWEMKTVTMEIPAGVLYLAFPVSCALMIIVNIRNIIRHIKGEF